MEQTVTIRVTGLGHKVTLKDLPASSTTVTDLRKKVYEAIGLPPRFQKLIGPQKLNINYLPENDAKYDADLGTRTLSDLGIQDRTKIMLLHSPIYQSEKDAYETLKKVEGEIVAFENIIRTNAKETERRGFVSEMVTRICCRLDAVDLAGSKELRAERKELIRRAEGLEGVAAAEATKRSNAS